MKKLFEQAKIAEMTLKNRFVRSATWENMADSKGHMNEKLYEVYQKLAQGEVGLIITGYANVIEQEQPNPGMMGIYEDSFIAEYKKLTDMVHQYGSKIVMQVAYGGTKTTYKVGERVIYAPSDVAEMSTKVAGKPMTKEEIKYVVEAFGQSARRVKEAGFDGIEIHGAHTYLINQFLSPYYNTRTDEYGASLDNRMRFLLEIYQAMRHNVGKEFPILVKLTATEFFDGGVTFEETRQICRKLAAVGVDAIELSGNIHAKAQKMVGQTFDGYALKEEGYFVEYAKVISSEVEVPIITVGGFKNIEAVEKILNETGIEYFALSRPLLAEPDLIKRWQQGDRAGVKCIRCSKCRTPEGNYCVVFDKKHNVK